MGRMGPATRMEGMNLPGGWTVGKQIGPGGSRSVGYEVTGSDGKPAFLKALDLFRAYQEEDILAAIDEISSSIRHERDLIDLCAEHKMSRVIRGLSHGVVKLDEHELGVWYLIFERADGDVRHELAKIREDGHIWRLRTLHEAAVGLDQMHRRGLCHQNVKPAHLLAFGAQGIKLGDLSTTSMLGAPPPMFDADAPGDPAYAAPECLYGFRLAEDLESHRARDMYLFGSLILFVYAEVTTTTALLMRLPTQWHPSGTASFVEALPHLEHALDLVIEEELSGSDCPPLLIESFRELCAPDPRRRGHPRARAERHGSPFSVQRYVSRLALLILREPSGEDKRRAA